MTDRRIVAFDELITHRLAGFVGVCCVAPGASGGEPVPGGGATTTGDLRLELTCDARHLAGPMLIVRSFPAAGVRPWCRP